MFSSTSRKLLTTYTLYAVILTAWAFSFASAAYFEAWVVDPTTVKSELFIVSDTKPLASSGAEFPTSVGNLNITAFNAGGTAAKCSGDQLDFSVTIAMKADTSAFAPILRIQSYNGTAFNTLSMGILGIEIPLNFSIQQLAPAAPAIFYPGQTYNIEMNFKDAPVDTPIGVKPVCVNLNIRQIVAKISSLSWLTFDMLTNLGSPFYLNIVKLGTPDEVIASIKICLQTGQCS